MIWLVIAWKQKKNLPTLHALNFCGHEAHVASADVLSALACVAGANLRILDLSGCSRIRDTDMEEMLRQVRISCPKVHTVDITGCNDQVCLCSVGICAEWVFGVDSPLELFARLKALQQLTWAATRFTWADLRARQLAGPECSTQSLSLRQMRCPMP